MIRIEFPPGNFKIEKREKIDHIFDNIRKRWVVLTPEEWVRQNIIQYLLQVKNYPASLFSIEKEIKAGELRKRCDIVIYDRNSDPWMIIECKEMRAPLNVKVSDQILAYNLGLKVPFLIITNGSFCYGFNISEGKVVEIEKFPEFSFEV